MFVVSTVAAFNPRRYPITRGEIMPALQRILLACLGIVGLPLTAPAWAQEVTVKVGAVRSISTATILWGIEKGSSRNTASRS
jgi:hypothetical protein